MTKRGSQCLTERMLLFKQVDKEETKDMMSICQREEIDL